MSFIPVLHIFFQGSVNKISASRDYLRIIITGCPAIIIGYAVKMTYLPAFRTWPDESKHDEPVYLERFRLAVATQRNVFMAVLISTSFENTAWT